MNPGKKIFRKLGEILMHPVSKTFVLLLTIGLTSLAIYGLTELRQEFNPVWFIPIGSYLQKWFAVTEQYFPESGERVTVNIGEIDYSRELWKIEELVKLLSKEEDIISEVDSWLTGFRKYLENNQLIEGE